MTTDELASLTRKPDRGGDRALLDEVLDEARVGVLSTVTDNGMPWSVPMLAARDGDRLLIHGSSGAGALRHVAAGAPVTFTAFLIDGLVVAQTLFDHSINYRSAVVRGALEAVGPDDASRALDVFSDAILPGRSAEVRAHTRKELSATVILALPILDGCWLTKARTGGPGDGGADGWTGHIPMRTIYDDPVTATPGAVPDSVTRLTNRSSRGDAEEQ
ncbi:pyridoxamine 5'-phosphate oxidase family protein [Gordonia sp. HNM0687]|uniref:Pyridoxamine 5'-phosphate oxidase family protein n=1 Tax=Gordonia mangrovi TaxID=2665643 RepID=A0A6L7GIZ5_9ACTN|nr:pyridoxamine 5'-phosphate oxidase family protein [Gordonia mangrovi]MXP19844.1 pyridoxamine 5'-phosphate oxidase family protein [Gordonia mangrovi]UVF79532.1 pyridoxamine 5'-phosphate oxidase family protein [Gordonia mangrovi]